MTRSRVAGFDMCGVYEDATAPVAVKLSSSGQGKHHYCGDHGEKTLLERNGSGTAESCVAPKPDPHNTSMNIRE